MEFGICFKGTLSPAQARYLVRQAEYSGFDYCWFYDSPILWRDCYTVMAMCMEHTKTMRFGPCVTNANSRDWSVAASLFGSLSLQSEGRFDLGVGRGDSAMRVMGKKPSTLARMAEFSTKVKAMVRGEKVVYDGAPEPVQFPWAPGHDLTAWFAAYGPKALATAGRHGDGVVLQIADPDLCRWFKDQAVAAGEAAGRDMSNYKVMAAAPAFTGTMAQCVERTKWFPAMVGNHVADIVAKYGKDTNLVPRSLTAYIEKRRGYDYARHGESDNPFLDFISPEIVQSFCVLGAPEQHVEKLKLLRDAGVTQFNIYFENGDEERLIADYAKYIIPYFK